MSVKPEKKKQLIKKFATAANDTGSPEVQIAILSERIVNLTEHFKQNVNDVHSRRGLLVMVNRRRKLLDYLKKVNQARYEAIIKQLDIRK